MSVSTDDREMLQALLDKADPKMLAKLKKKMTQKPKANIYQIRKSPLKTWKPRHVEDTRMALNLIKTGVGVHKYSDELPADQVNTKLLCSSVVERLLFDKNKKAVENNYRAWWSRLPRLCLSSCVASPKKH